MENRKELKFQAEFDTEDFDKSVDSMQKKLKALQNESDISRLQTQTSGRLQQAGLNPQTKESPKADPQQNQQIQQVKDVFQRFVTQLQQIQYSQKPQNNDQKQQVTPKLPEGARPAQPAQSAQAPEKLKPQEAAKETVQPIKPQDQAKDVKEAYQGFVKELEQSGEPEKVEKVKQAFQTYSEQSKTPEKAPAAYENFIKQVKDVQETIPSPKSDAVKSAHKAVEPKKTLEPLKAEQPKPPGYEQPKQPGQEQPKPPGYEQPKPPADKAEEQKSPVSKATMEGYQKASQPDRRALDSLIKEEAVTQDKLGKELAVRIETLKKMKEQYAESVKLGKEDLELKEKIGRVEENNLKIAETYKQRDSVLNEMLDIRQQSPMVGKESLDKFFGKETSGGAPSGGGGGGLPGTGGIMGGGSGGPAAAAAMAPKVMGVIASILGGGAELYKQVYESQFKTKIATGSAIQNTVGRELDSVYSGRAPYENAFMSEKGKAFETASKLTDHTKTYDKLKLASGAAGLVGSAAGLASSAGAAGTVLGIPAGIVGAGASLAGGALSLGALAGNERMRSLSLGTASQGISDAVGAFPDAAKKIPLVGGMAEKAVGAVARPVQGFFGDIAKEQNSQYQSHLAKDFADNFQKALNAEKEQNPLKRLAAEEYQGSFMRNLNFQRTTGTNYDSFHGAGGFREQNINAGFTDKMGMEQAEGILGSGGSTRMARDASFGLKLQRGADLTNSASVLGTLSGGLGSSESTKSATIKILSEGMRLGLDQSQFAEENRKFVQATADIVSRSGAKGDTDIERVISQFGKFQAEPTSKGIEAARGAYETYQQATGSTQGPQGAIRAAGFIKDKVLGSLSAMDRAALASVPMEQLGEDHPIVQDIARRTGETPQSIVDRTKKVSESAIHRLAKGDQLTDSIKKTRNKLAEAQQSGGMGGLKESEALGQQLTEQKQQLSTVFAVEYPALAKDKRQLESIVEGTTSNDPDKKQKAAEDLKKAGSLNEKMEKSDTGRPEDNSVKALAESSKLMLDNFRDFHKEIIPTVESVKQFNDALKGAVKQLLALPEGQRGGALNDIFNLFSGKSSSPAPEQPHGGKAGQ